LKSEVVSLTFLRPFTSIIDSLLHLADIYLLSRVSAISSANFGSFKGFLYRKRELFKKIDLPRLLTFVSPLPRSPNYRYSCRTRLQVIRRSRPSYWDHFLTRGSLFVRRDIVISLFLNFSPLSLSELRKGFLAVLSARERLSRENSSLLSVLFSFFLTSTSPTVFNLSKLNNNNKLPLRQCSTLRSSSSSFPSSPSLLSLSLLRFLLSRNAEDTTLVED